MKILELNHVAIAVTQVEASVRFYRDQLGLSTLPRPNFPFPGAWFRLGQHQELHLIGGWEGPAGSGNSQEGHFALLVDDLDAFGAKLRSAGLVFRGPGLRPDGARQIFVADPDGNVVELCSQLPGR